MTRDLDPATWRRVSPLLDRALDLEAEARQGFLAEVRAEHPDIAPVLESLLDEHERLAGEGFLERQLSPQPGSADETPGFAAMTDIAAMPDLGAGMADADAGGMPSLAGTTVGAYTLEVPLGTGGMGSVWRARRSDGRFEGSVAVKLLHLAVIESGGAERFTREGTLLARLAHPHIGRLLDAGVTTAGQPYLVLEYVEGVRIDEYADAKRLDVRGRLDLFQQVADAVAHAHAHLIVHRDLKPSNILVDASGRVKLLDFGIAKLLDDDNSPAAMEVTRTGARALTPAYAAPEQVRGEPVTTTTDVYALGVLLYHLLVDVHPTGANCTTPADYVRAIVDIDPPLPSVAIASADAETAARVAAARSTTPDVLRRTLRGDLDNILAVALRKNPERRYASVAAFVDDVRRYLRDEPVVARPDRWTYRARKFVRRHRGAVAAAAIVLITLIAATVVTTDRMLEARRQRDDAAAAARLARATSDFMRNMVTQIGDTPVTMKTVLDRGRQAIEQQYGHDPAFVARVLSDLSSPYVELGDYETAKVMRTRALELATRVGDAELLAGLHAQAARDAIEDRALPAVRTHLAEARRQLDRLTDHPTDVIVEYEIAASELADAEERFDAAVDHARRAVTLLQQEGNRASVRYVTALNNLSTVYRDAGRFSDAVPVLREMVAVTTQIGQARTVTMAVHLSNLGVTERRVGWWLAAERTLREAVDLSRGIEASGRIPASRMQNYGRVLVALGRRAEGKDWLARSLEQTDAPPRFLSAARLAYASVLAEEGNVAGARDAIDRAVGELPGARTPAERMALTMSRVHLAVAEGARDRARALIDEELKTEGYPGQLSPLVHEPLEYGARLALAAGDRERAAQLARDAIAACERYFGTEPSAHTGRAQMTLGLAYAAAGRTADARSLLERAIASLTAAAGADHPWVQEARARLVSLGR